MNDELRLKCNFSQLEGRVTEEAGEPHKLGCGVQGGEEANLPLFCPFLPARKPPCLFPPDSQFPLLIRRPSRHQLAESLQ